MAAKYSKILDDKQHIAYNPS